MANLHCELCGATLRRPEQFYELARPDHNDSIYLCRDETRCGARARFDPPTRTLSPRQVAPRGERSTVAGATPIRVHRKDGGWQVDYGSYVQGYHAGREEAIEQATTAAARENRKLIIEDAKLSP
jgi:hypothetical protein